MILKNFDMKKRASGILLHISSLPSRYGIGDLGPQAYKFAEFLVRSKQGYWQILSLNPLTLTENPFSPYNCLSAFAGNTLFISCELLYRKGFLTKKEIQDKADFPEGFVDYRLVNAYKNKLFNTAFGRFNGKAKEAAFEGFCLENKRWLEDYAVFVALRRRFQNRLWCSWPAGLRDREKQVLKTAKAELKDDIKREKFLQYIFFEQWFSLKKYCGERGIKFIGDIPFYVAYDSADVWANPGMFKLTKGKEPRYISGVPPDLFSSTGQLWGNPVYDWQSLKKTGYDWWIQRVGHNLTLFDKVRIDHFRGFVSFWQVLAKSKNAVKGKWIKGPGEDFFGKLSKKFAVSSFIAEDLGYITDDVRELVEKFQFAGMKVLQFAFDGEAGTNPHSLENHLKNAVVYTGTHDNNTVKGWFSKEARLKQKERLFQCIGYKVSETQIHWELIRLVMSSVCDTAILPMQDVLGLDERARMNRPARIRGNWRWQLKPGQLKVSTAKKLAGLCETYDRG